MGKLSVPPFVLLRGTHSLAPVYNDTLFALTVTSAISARLQGDNNILSRYRFLLTDIYLTNNIFLRLRSLMDLREQRGVVLAATKKISRYGGERWKVPSQTGLAASYSGQPA